jgi:NACalpha-BTF3-like transcription factor
MTEQQLFDSLVQQELAALAVKTEVKAITEAAKEADIDKEDIKLIKKAAKLHANTKFEEMQAENEALIAKYEELVNA